jgi:phosphatidylglycerophosphate synthase
MLARIKENGSRLGLILDGISDYIVSIAVYLGIGIGYASRSETPALLWTLVVGAALSNAIQSGLLDFYRNRYLDITRDRDSVLEKDLDALRDEHDLLRREERKPVLRGLLWIYLRYSVLQQLLITQKQLRAPRPRANRAEFVRANRQIMFFWTFLGPTTQMSLLVVASLVNRLDLYLWAIVVVGNAAAVLLKLLQNGIDSRLGMSEP